MQLFSKKRKEVEDVLEQKKRALTSYTRQFDSAVSLVLTTVDNLNALDEHIQSTIDEINEYQSELDNTKNGLISAQNRSQRVIKNFESLLAID